MNLSKSERCVAFAAKLARIQNIFISIFWPLPTSEATSVLRGKLLRSRCHCQRKFRPWRRKKFLILDLWHGKWSALCNYFVRNVFGNSFPFYLDNNVERKTFESIRTNRSEKFKARAAYGCRRHRAGYYRAVLLVRWGLRQAVPVVSTRLLLQLEPLQGPQEQVQVRPLHSPPTSGWSGRTWKVWPSVSFTSIQLVLGIAYSEGRL